MKCGICVIPRFAKSLRYGCRPACGDVEVADLEVFITITTTDHLLFQIRQVLVANLPRNHYLDGAVLAGACQCSLQCRPICQQASRCFVLHCYEAFCFRRLHQCRALPSGGRYAQCAHPCFVYFQFQLVAGIGLGGDVVGGEVLIDVVSDVDAYHQSVCGKGLPRQHQGVVCRRGIAVLQQADIGRGGGFAVVIMDDGLSVGIHGEVGFRLLEVYGGLLQLFGGDAVARQQVDA